MSERSVSVSRVIAAPAAEIFAILSTPAGHVAMDGSGTVREPKGQAAESLTLGSKFGMKMHLGVPYQIGNEVVEFEQDRLIAWQHFGKHRWRFELAEVDGGVEVTETFDWSTSRAPKLIELLGYPKKHPVAMAKTLENLERLVTPG